MVISLKKIGARFEKIRTPQQFYKISMEIVQLDGKSEYKDIKILCPSKDTININNLKSHDLISTLKEEIYSRYELPPSNFSIRLIYKGKLLSDHSTLDSISDEETLAIHCSINEKSSDSSHTTNQHIEARPVGFER